MCLCNFFKLLPWAKIQIPQKLSKFYFFFTYRIKAYFNFNTLFPIFQYRHRHWNQPVSVTDQCKKLLYQKCAELVLCLTVLNTSCRMLPVACNNLNVWRTNESNHKPIFSTEKMTQKWGLKFTKAESLWSDTMIVGSELCLIEEKRKTLPESL